MAEIKIIGDSILKGAIYNEKTNSYQFNNYLKDIPNSENLSKFGCTIVKGSTYIKKILDKDISCRYVLMNFGGNDADYSWKEINNSPYNVHMPKTTIETFVSTYIDLIKYIRSKNIKPVLTTLTLMDSSLYLNYFCKTLECNKSNILIWLKEINEISKNQNRYSEMIKQISFQEKTDLIDIREAMLKETGYSAFNDCISQEKTNKNRLRKFLCSDGIHINTLGQNIVHNCIKDYFSSETS